MLKLKPAKYTTTVIGQFGTPSTVTISCQSVEEQLNRSNLIIIGKEQHIAAAVLMYIDI